MFAASYDLLLGRAYGSPAEEQVVFERVVPTGRLPAKRGGKRRPASTRRTEEARYPRNTVGIIKPRDGEKLVATGCSRTSLPGTSPH